jgi:hypothetical protein
LIIDNYFIRLLDLVRKNQNDPDLASVDRLILDKTLSLCVQPESKPNVTIKYKIIKGESAGDFNYDVDHKEIIT